MGPNEDRGPEPAALDASEKGRGGPVRRLWMKTLQTEQMASYAVTAVHPAEPASNIVLQKRLSNSDVSGQVLKTGRIVLPRGFMETFATDIIAAGCIDLCPANVHEPRAAWNLRVIDSNDREWIVLLKKWTTTSSMQPRPIYVFEGTAKCMKANSASPGDTLQLSISQSGDSLGISIIDLKDVLKSVEMKGDNVSSPNRDQEATCSPLLCSRAPPKRCTRPRRGQSCVKVFSHEASADDETNARLQDVALAGELLVSISNGNFGETCTPATPPTSFLGNLDKAVAAAQSTHQSETTQTIHRPRASLASAKEGHALYAALTAGID